MGTTPLTQRPNHGGVHVREISLVIAILLSGPVVADESPNHGEISMEGISYQGSGCPAGSVASNLSPDAKAMTLLFDRYIVETQAATRPTRFAPERKTTKVCKVDVRMRVPSGWSFGIFYVDFRGFADLQSNTLGIQRAAYHFGGRKLLVGDYRLRGEYSDDYFYRYFVPVSSLVWSPCDISKWKDLRINTSITVRGGLGQMTVDSIDGELTQQYAIAWRRCRWQTILLGRSRKLEDKEAVISYSGNEKFIQLELVNLGEDPEEDDDDDDDYVRLGEIKVLTGDGQLLVFHGGGLKIKRRKSFVVNFSAPTAVREVRVKVRHKTEGIKVIGQVP